MWQAQVQDHKSNRPEVVQRIFDLYIKKQLKSSSDHQIRVAESNGLVMSGFRREAIGNGSAHVQCKYTANILVNAHCNSRQNYGALTGDLGRGIQMKLLKCGVPYAAVALPRRTCAALDDHQVPMHHNCHLATFSHFAIMLSPVRLSSVTFVRPILRQLKFSATIISDRGKILRRSSQGNTPIRG